MILNIYKPTGSTSFAIVKKIREITSEKVGHGGTLDPFAEGVLVLGTGKDTKKLTTITNDDKSYVATIQLGATTDTLDIESEITKKKEIPSLNENVIENVLKSFLGESAQTPPMYSAKKINGKKLYDLARKNISVKRTPTNITIKNIELLEFKGSSIRFSVTCTKGTYIRVLGYDIAEKLGTIGYLVRLIRTRVGEHLIQDSKTIENFRVSWKSFEH